MKENARLIGSGLIWSFGERIVAQLVSTIVSIVLARLLVPSDYGIISIVMVFINLCDVFVTSGMGSAIVQRKDVDEGDYNTAFTINLFMSSVLYCAIFLTAPEIAKFYGTYDLSPVLRVMGLRLPIAALNSIQQARVQRMMAFKRFFIATLLGTVTSAFIGIGMAVYGYGAWALVGQYMSSSVINTVVLICISHWIPRIKLSYRKAKTMIGFGSKVLLSQLMSTLTNDIRSLVIGKQFGATDLAYFDQGKKFPALLVNNLNIAINKVMLPAYAQHQDDTRRLKGMLRRSISIGVFLLCPVMIGFAAISESFVYVVYTEKWLPCVPYIQLFCLSYLTRALESSCHQALLAMGEAGSVLKILIIVDVTNLITILIAALCFRSVFLIAVGMVICTIVSVLCFLITMHQKIKYSGSEMIYDIVPTILACIAMWLCIQAVSLLNMSMLLTMIFQILVGATAYLAISATCRIEPFVYLLNNVLMKKNRRKNRNRK